MLTWAEPLQLISIWRVNKSVSINLSIASIRRLQLLSEEHEVSIFQKAPWAAGNGWGMYSVAPAAQACSRQLQEGTLRAWAPQPLCTSRTSGAGRRRSKGMKNEKGDHTGVLRGQRRGRTLMRAAGERRHVSSVRAHTGLRLPREKSTHTEPCSPGKRKGSSGLNRRLVLGNHS